MIHGIRHSLEEVKTLQNHFDKSSRIINIKPGKKISKKFAENIIFIVAKAVTSSLAKMSIKDSKTE